MAIKKQFCKTSSRVVLTLDRTTLIEWRTIMRDSKRYAGTGGYKTIVDIINEGIELCTTDRIVDHWGLPEGTHEGEVPQND